MHAYDYSRRQHKILHDYLGQDKIINVNKRNIEVLREINEVFIDYTPILQRLVLISSLLKRIDHSLDNQWIKIGVSLKKQKFLFIACRYQLKKCGITEEQYNAISYSIKKFKKRLIWVRDYMFPEYINLTPLKEYEEKLIANGQSLDDILSNHIEQHCNNVEEDFDDVADNIMQEMANDTKYLERLEKYYTRKKALVEKTKNEKSKEKLSKKIEIAQERLAYLSKGVHRNITYNLDNFHKFDFDKLHECKVRGDKFAKIIITCYVTGRSNARLHYVNRNATLGESLSNAMVLGENDPVPASIQEMVDTNKIAICEILFPI